MKKIFSFFFAAVAAITAVSCVHEQPATIDDGLAVAPVIQSYDVNEDGVSVIFTPGSFNQQFNGKMPVNHSLVIVSINDDPTVKILSSSVSGNTISVSRNVLNRALMSLGFGEGDRVNLELSLRASMQEAALDNGRNGYVESVGRVSVKNFEVTVPQGSPYEGFDQISTWSITGALPNYGIDWNGDLVMWTDGTTHVAAHVSLTADDAFKFRKDAAWAVNMGGTFGSLDGPFAVSQDGPDIKVGAAGVYDIFYDSASNTAWVSEAYDPYPDYTQSSSWGVTGALPKHNIDWNGDIAMISDGTNHVALSVSIGADDKFKFRKDAGWTENLGGDFTGLDSDFPVTQDGPDIFVGTEGVYDLFVNPNAGTAKVTAASGAKVSYVAGGNEEPVGITGWNIIGLNGDWDNDILATQEGNVWTAIITANGDTVFKWRKDGDWAENYGGTFVALGEPFEAVAGGPDIAIPEGSYKVVLDLDALTITITTVTYEIPDIDLSQFTQLPEMAGANTWGIIGPAANDWNTDIDLAKISDDPEIWAAMNIPFQADVFKFRGNDEWGDYDLGGGSFAVEEPIVLTKGGSDITAERGVYTVFLYPTYGIAYFQKGSGEVPEPDKPQVWSLVGYIFGTGWDTDFDLSNIGGDVWKYSGAALNEGDEFKIRADHDWNKSYGGPEANATSTAEEGNPYEVYQATIGETFAAGGMNVRIPATGIYDITFTYGEEPTILITEHSAVPEQLFMIGEAIGGWEWSSDYIAEFIPVLNQPSWGSPAEAQFWCVRYLEGGKGFKFNSAKAWDGNDFYQLETNEGFTTDGGNCFVATSGHYLIHIDFSRSILHIEPARVYGFGEAFGTWDEGQGTLFTADGMDLKAVTKSSGELRLYVDSEIATSPWWSREFIFFDEGKIEYRGGGDDQARYKVGAGQTVVLNFNAGTGKLEGEPQVEPEEPYGLIGWHANDSWSTNVELEDVAGNASWKVAKHIGAASGNIDFKFRRGTKWVPQVGALLNSNKELNEKIRLKEKTEDSEPDPYNIHLNGNGLYDIYFNESEMLLFILESGSAFAVPDAWEKDPSQIVDIWGVIGSAFDNGWDSDTAMFEDEGGDYLTIRSITMKGGEGFKFRANHAWSKQLTAGRQVEIGTDFELIDGEGNPDTTIPADGVYDIYLAKDFSKARIESVGSPAVNISVDGDMSDWANVSGTVREPDSGNAIWEIKGAADADYIYVYIKRAKIGRWGDLWGGDSSNAGYYYYDFDLDNNAETGEYAENSHGNYEAYTYLYIFGGTKDAPVFRATPPGSAKGMSIDNVRCAGTVTDDAVEVEIAFPRADLPAISGDTISVSSWGNKDANPVTKVTFKL